MKKYIHMIFAMSLLLLAIISCTTREPISTNNVLQIKDTGLRQGVFIRRYQLTGEYGSNSTFTVDMLKDYIARVLEPNYILIQHAYDVGMDERDDIARKIKDYRVNLLADSHPMKYEEMTILKQELRDFYQKKSNVYDVDIVQAASFAQADSIHDALVNGEQLSPQKEFLEGSFPRTFRDPSLVYGEGLHPDIFSTLLNMRENDVSRPIYAASIWTVVKLNAVKKNNNLPPFENIEQTLLGQAQSFFKYDQQKQFVDDLKTTYNTSYRTDLLTTLTEAFSQQNNGIIDREQIAPSLQNSTFISIGDENVSLDDFIAAFNQATQFKKITKLSVQDIEQFIHDYTAQYCLYLDAIDKGVDQDELTRDKLQNKEHRLLLSAYLNDEIMTKLELSDQEIRAHYQANPDKWRGSFDSVALNVKGDLRRVKLSARKDEIVNRLKKKYNVVYNDALLQTIADQFTEIKKAEAGVK